MNNPYLKKSKKTRKYGTPVAPKKDTLQIKESKSKNSKKTPKKQTLKNETLMTLNSTEKNPIIFPSTLKNYIHKKQVLLSPQELSKLSINMSNKIASFDDRLKVKSKVETQKIISSMNYPSKGILRWDDFSFTNKDSVFKAERKNIKKKLKDKKVIKHIDSYRENQKKIITSMCSINEKSIGSSDTSDTQRKDVFGNNIIKGGNRHRVCFSFHGDLKVVENWKELNKINSIKPDKSLALEDIGDKKKCVIF
jgi:PBP1b-binding outer membrane lipoprotein LpoB